MTVISQENIDIFNKEQLSALQERLLGFSQGDAAHYAAQVQEFMVAAGVPVVALEAEGATAVESFINGVPIYAVKSTTKDEYDNIHTKARASSELWNAMPLEARQEFFRIMSQEVGAKYKPAIDLAITLEVGKAGSEFAKLAEWDNWASGEAVHDYLANVYMEDDQGRRFTEDNIPEDSKVIFFHQNPRSGVGISAATCGFNYPGALIQPDVSSSRVAGNAFIGKTAAKAPAYLFIRRRAEEEALEVLAERFADYPWAAAAKDAGVDLSDPAVVQGLKDGFGIISGRDVIEKWAKDADVFRLVGGGAAGDLYRGYREEVDARLDRTILELAGNNPVVVMPSAAELEGGLEKVVAQNADGNKSNSGQRCTSPRRWFVHADVYDKVKEMAVASYSMDATSVDNPHYIGNPLDPKSKVGAMEKNGFKEAQDYLDRAREAGATVTGGDRLYHNQFPHAYYMSPALVIWDGVQVEKQGVMHEKEVFAPIANLVRISSLEDAITKTNLSREGLSGAVYTNDADELMQFSSHTNLGSLIHNGPPKDQSPKGIHAGRDHGGIGITGSVESLGQYSHTPDPNVVVVDAAVVRAMVAEKKAASK